MSRDLALGATIDWAATNPKGYNNWGIGNLSYTQGAGALSAFPTWAYQPIYNEFNVFVQGTTATTQDSIAFAPSGTPSGLTYPYMFGATTSSSTTTNNFKLLPSTNSRQVQGTLVALNPLQGKITVGTFAGSGNYLTIPDSSNFDMGSGNFTIECWFYPPTNTGSSIFTKRSSNVNVAPVQLNWGSGQFTVYMSTDGSTWNISSSTLATYSLDNWYHLALVRSSNTISLYVNGSTSLTTYNASGIMNTISISGAVMTNSAPFVIGADAAASIGSSITANISNFRIVKGIALYTSTFITSVNPFTVTQDANINGNPSAAISTSSYTTLLTLQDTGAILVDNSIYKATITNFGPVTFTQQTTAFSGPSGAKAGIPFTTRAYNWTELRSSINGTGGGVTTRALITATSQLTFNGTSQFLNITEATPGTTLSFGTSAFTIDGFFNRSSTSTTSTVATKGATTGTGWAIYISAANVVVYNDSTVTITGTTVIQNNTWYHIAVSRNSTGANDTRLFVNGNLEASGTSSANLNQTDVLRIGVGKSTTLNFWPGNISHFRLIKNSAYYTTNFLFKTIAPTTPLDMPVPSSSNIANTALVVCAASTGSYYAASFTGNNYLTIPYQAGYNIGASVPFSFEAWVYTTSASPFFMASRNWNYGGTGPTWAFWLTDGRTAQMSDNQNPGTPQPSAFTMGVSTVLGTLGKWTHYAFSRDSSGVFRIFVNGAVGYTRGPDVQSTSSFTSASGDIYIGVPSNLGAYSTGLMSNMRFVVGNAVYTGAFTVPPLNLTTTTSAGTNINAITTETALLILQDINFRGNDNVSTSTSYITNTGLVTPVQFLNTASSSTQYTDLSPLYGTLNTVASIVTATGNLIQSYTSIGIINTNTSVSLEVPLYNYPNTSSWVAGATIPYQYIGQTNNINTFTNRARSGGGSRNIAGVEALVIELSGQVFYKDGRFKPINNANDLIGYGWYGNKSDVFQGIQDTDSALQIQTLNQSAYAGAYARAVPTGYMSYNNPSYSASLIIQADASFYVGGPSSGYVGGSSAIFITSGYVNPDAPLGPGQLISRLRQVWAAN